MALLSFCGLSTPSLPAQGEQRRSSLFNSRRDIALAVPVTLSVAALARGTGAVPGNGWLLFGEREPRPSGK
jgi:hypothetical protein